MTLCEGEARKANPLALIFPLLRLSLAEVCCLQSCACGMALPEHFKRMNTINPQRAHPPCDEMQGYFLLGSTRWELLPFSVQSNGWCSRSGLLRRVKMQTGLQEHNTAWAVLLLSSLCASSSSEVQEQRESTCRDTGSACSWRGEWCCSQCSSYRPAAAACPAINTSLEQSERLCGAAQPPPGDAGWTRSAICLWHTHKGS